MHKFILIIPNLCHIHAQNTYMTYRFVAGDVEDTERRGSDKSVKARIVVGCLPQCDQDTSSQVGHSQLTARTAHPPTLVTTKTMIHRHEKNCNVQRTSFKVGGNFRKVPRFF